LSAVSSPALEGLNQVWGELNRQRFSFAVQLGAVYEARQHAELFGVVEGLPGGAKGRYACFQEWTVRDDLTPSLLVGQQAANRCLDFEGGILNTPAGRLPASR